MKILGITAEFNPFHNGHQYFLKEARKKSQADVVIVALSGNFVQRGEPAIVDKFTRADAALINGADLVVEMPTISCLSSSFEYAFGAVNILIHLGCNAIAFGSETTNQEYLRKAAYVIDHCQKYSMEYSTPAYIRDLNAAIYQKIKSGISYPGALYGSIEECFPEIKEAFSGANSKLAIEYIRSINATNRIYHTDKDIELIPIQRVGNEHDSREIDIENHYASATRIRELLSANDSITGLIPSNLSEAFANNLLTADKYINLNDFSEILNYKLLNEYFRCHGNNYLFLNNLKNIHGSSKELTMRIFRFIESREKFTDFDQFCKTIKTKNVTLSHVKRFLLCLLLDLKSPAISLANQSAENNIDSYTISKPYARILGFNKTGIKYLHDFKETEDIDNITLITKAADYKDLLNDDIHASDVYISMCNSKGIDLQDDFRHNLIIKKH